MGLRLFRMAALGVVLAAGLAVAACSSAGGESAANVLPQVQAAVQQATSVHMTGSVPDGKQTATFDVEFVGNSVAGSLGVNGHAFGLLVLNGTTYVKVDAAFLAAENAPPSVCAKICGKYVQLSPGTASQITGFLSMSALITKVFNANNLSAASNSACAFSRTTRHGEAVLECRHGAYAIDVAAHGTPYIVYFSGPHGEYLSFSDWNSLAPPSAPPASQVISIGALSG